MAAPILLTKEEFISRSEKKHGKNFDYSLVDYKDSKSKVTIICPIHGQFKQMPAMHISGNGCRACFNQKCKTWTSDQEDFLTKNFDNLTAKTIALRLNKTENAIYLMAKRMGLSEKRTQSKIPCRIISSSRKRAKEKKMEFDIDADFIFDLLAKQNGKCALTGWDIKFCETTEGNTASIDRIKSHLGYTKDNVQIVHKIVNFCKLNNSEHDFYAICRSVCQHRKDLQAFKTPEFIWDEWNDTMRPVVSETLFGEEGLKFSKEIDIDIL